MFLRVTLDVICFTLLYIRRAEDEEGAGTSQEGVRRGTRGHQGVNKEDWTSTSPIQARSQTN